MPDRRPYRDGDDPVWEATVHGELDPPDPDDEWVDQPDE
jgi:hypothetical protein